MILKTPEETAEVGAKLASQLRPGDVVTLSGPLGVGKTELARAILSALGFVGEAPSPTFAIVQPYDDLETPIWHVDLYRIEDPSELAELGLDEADDVALLVEWPERAGEGAWPEALRLTLDFTPDAARRLTAAVPPSWQSRWPLR